MKEAMIHIGSVKIPLLDYAVSCSAILGIRDSGKTVTAKSIAEQLLDHDIPIVVFDAVGKWRWMKVPGPGARGRGYKVVVAGGKAPDLALSPQSVGEIVRSAVKEKIPLIIDLYSSSLSKADWRKIVKESIRIIHYEACGVAHVFLEEAPEYIPQKPQDYDTYAEVEKLARMGGNASVGLTIIGQRSQEINKAVLDLAHNLILGCQIGSRAIDAVEKWVDRLSPDTVKALTTSLPHLKSGEAWVWTRSNPDDPKREHLPMCRSLHPDRRTPEVVLKSAKAVDPEAFVKRLRIAIPKLIEDAKAADPREWAKQKRELEHRIKQLESAKPAATTKTEVKTIEKRVVIEGTVTRLEKVLERAESLRDSLQEGVGALNTEAASIAGMLADARRLNSPLEQAPVKAAPSLRARQTEGYVPSVSHREIRAQLDRETNGDRVEGLSRMERKMMTALAQHPNGLTKQQVLLHASYASSGPVSKAFASLAAQGFFETRGSLLIITAEGEHALGSYDVLPTGEDLRAELLAGNKLNTMEKALLRAICEVYPEEIAKKDILAAANYASSGPVSKAFARLVRYGYSKQGRSGYLSASDVLFD